MATESMLNTLCLSTENAQVAFPGSWNKLAARENLEFSPRALAKVSVNISYVSLSTRWRTHWLWEFGSFAQLRFPQLLKYVYGTAHIGLLKSMWDRNFDTSAINSRKNCIQEAPGLHARPGHTALHEEIYAIKNWRNVAAKSDKRTTQRGITVCQLIKKVHVFYCCQSKLLPLMRNPSLSTGKQLRQPGNSSRKAGCLYVSFSTLSSACIRALPKFKMVSFFRLNSELFGIGSEPRLAYIAPHKRYYGGWNYLYFGQLEDQFSYFPYQMCRKLVKYSCGMRKTHSSNLRHELGTSETFECKGILKQF